HEVSQAFLAIEITMPSTMRPILLACVLWPLVIRTTTESASSALHFSRHAGAPAIGLESTRRLRIKRLMKHIQRPVPPCEHRRGARASAGHTTEALAEHHAPSMEQRDGTGKPGLGARAPRQSGGKRGEHRPHRREK